MNFETKKVNLLMIIALLAIFTLGACTPEGSASGGNPDANGTEVVQEPETEVEDEPEENYPGESEGQLPLVTSFAETRLIEGLEYYGFNTIVEQMNDGVTAYIIAEARSQHYEAGMSGTYGVITFYLTVDSDELKLTMTTEHHGPEYSLFERQHRNLGPINPDSVADLSLLDESTLAEISEFIHDTFYEVSSQEVDLPQWNHAVSRFFYDGRLAMFISSLPVIYHIDGEVMEMRVSNDEFLIFDRSDSTIRDSEGDLIIQGSPMKHKTESFYDGRIIVEDGDLDLLREAIESLTIESEEEAPW